MKSTHPAVCLVFLMLAALPVAATAATTQVAGEASRTPAQVAPTWKLASFPARYVTRQGYRELAIRRLVELENHNASQRIKATQIGVGRTLAHEGIERATPALRWVALKSGGAVARLQVGSPDALGLRVGLQVSDLHPHVELRIAGSDDPQWIVAMLTAAKAKAFADADGMYWTPATDGGTQIIEIYRPGHVTAAQARVRAPQVSHLLANSANNFKIVEKVGESASCNINAVCRVNQLGPAYVEAKNAVAHMMFNIYNTDGNVLGSYMCTGTLLNDTTPATQVPWFYTADHCFRGGGDVPVQDRSKVAASLTTYWGYESTSCSSTNGSKNNALAGGADIMFYDANVDAILLRLKNPAPAGATFAGWDASTLAPNADVIAIHHPSGDAKKYSRGQHVADSYAEQFTVGWLEGTTEGGSSGSGLFTRHADSSYRLRGGLYGGDASCANTGNIANAENRDHYSRLDLVFPRIKQWIAADPVREHGSQPLVRTAGAIAQGQGARAAGNAAASTRPTRPATGEHRPTAPMRTTQRER
ncbi:serine protease [Pseudoxanthomonas sp. F37]|uniref:trypsin-like serine peptidase n=1 Tax=Pseudoxanthomonas TaxID=83618 RepID=UPI001FD2834C|nr:MULTISPECIES: serine protease [Pseudoxanthomonas]UOV06077.1 serine protease [Pseudoxanthomonas mexicana]UOV07664.1 serine protease [Pseudoxanthomonas sp. F37]